MKSCSFQDEGNKSKEETKIDINKVIANCNDGMKEKMENNKRHVIKRVKWFMFLPGLILISAFLLTFFLNPEVAQIFWLIITGTLITSGFLFMLMIHRWFSKLKKQLTT
jgi:pheromone shutdown protein TraB